MTTPPGSYPCPQPRAIGDYTIMARTRKSVGNSHNATHLPIYQGLVAVMCDNCTKVHKMMFVSDERDAVEHHVAAFERILSTGGYSPASIIVESFHRATDLDIREWARIEELLDEEIAF